MVGFMVYGLGSASQKRSGVLTIHATHRDLLLTGYAHVQTHRFFLFFYFFYKRYIFPL